MSIDDVLKEIQPRLALEAATEHDVLEEIRGHLEEAIADARAQGRDEREALRAAALAFGIAEAAAELRATHAGRGTLDGVAAAALPVLGALTLRWLIFAPAGTADHWRTMLTKPSFVVVGAAAMLIPLLRFPRRRSAMALWAFFWGVSLVTAVWPTLRW